MRPKQRSDYSPGPARSRIADRFQRLHFRLDRQPITRLSLNGSSAMRGHVAQGSENFLDQNALARRAHAFQARPNAAASRGDLFIRSALDAFLKIYQAWADENWMRVRIDEPGQNDFARAIDLDNLLMILFQPGIAQGIFGCANGNDLSAEA